MRSDIVKMYKSVHTWVGITTGLALFIAFYAGAITMFEEPLNRWASPPAKAETIVPLADVEALVAATVAQYPEARENYTIHVTTGPEIPGRMSWVVWPEGRGHDAPRLIYYSNLTADGGVEVIRQKSTNVAKFIDVLHQQVGLPFDHEIAMPIMGIVALLYGVALISGVIILMPSLVRDLFAIRLGQNLKRMWLDVHNVLGLFSLPFHILIALTSVVFAYHDLFYAGQNQLLYEGRIQEMFQANASPRQVPVQDGVKLISPTQAIDRLKAAAPGYTVHALTYKFSGQKTVELAVKGSDARHIQQRSGGYGFVLLNAYTGEILSMDLMPGRQSTSNAVISSFFTLHFGSFGGEPIRWGYFILGLAGAFIFYSGNLLWIESRRKKQRKAGIVAQTKSARVMGALTVGVSLGCISGIAVAIAAAKAFPDIRSDVVYYSVFGASIIWPFICGAAGGAVHLLYTSAGALMLIPAVSILSSILPGFGWNHMGGTLIVDVVAAIGAMICIPLAHRTRSRVRNAPEDSIWYEGTDGNIPIFRRFQT